MKRGFTLLELIISLTIMMVAFGIGIVGILNYRNYVQFESVNSDMVTAIKDLQNKANNSVSHPDLGSNAPYAYALFFQNGDYKAYYCQLVSLSAKLVRCFEDTVSGSRSIASINNVTLSSNCAGIGFVKLNTKIIAINASALLGIDAAFRDGGDDCLVTIQSNSSANDKKVITVNLVNNSVNI